MALNGGAGGFHQGDGVCRYAMVGDEEGEWTAEVSLHCGGKVDSSSSTIREGSKTGGA